MPKVLFWNVQRSSGNLNTLSGYQLCEDLAGLAEDPLCKPDVMVLCECNLGFMEETDICPSGYALAEPDTSRGSYADDFTLRYALLHNTKTLPRCVSFLLDTAAGTSKLRPALGVIAGEAAVIALHAASISHSSSVQIGQIKRAFEGFAKHPLVPANHRAPDVMVGDFNIDFAAHGTGGIRGALGDHAIAAAYTPRSSRQGTHRSSQAATHESVLDWAFFSSAIEDGSIRVVKPVPQVRQGPNELLKLRFHGLKPSDHLPILVRW